MSKRALFHILVAFFIVNNEENMRGEGGTVRLEDHSLYYLAHNNSFGDFGLNLSECSECRQLSIDPNVTRNIFIGGINTTVTCLPNEAILKSTINGTLEDKVDNVEQNASFLAPWTEDGELGKVVIFMMETLTANE